MSTKVICITGGTSGVGFEAVAQLANDERVSKIILTSRTEASAKRAFGRLTERTGKGAELFWIPDDGPE